MIKLVVVVIELTELLLLIAVVLIRLKLVVCAQVIVIIRLCIERRSASAVAALRRRSISTISRSYLSRRPKLIVWQLISILTVGNEKRILILVVVVVVVEISSTAALLLLLLLLLLNGTTQADFVNHNRRNKRKHCWRYARVVGQLNVLTVAAAIFVAIVAELKLQRSASRTFVFDSPVVLIGTLICCRDAWRANSTVNGRGNCRKHCQADGDGRKNHHFVRFRRMTDGRSAEIGFVVEAYENFSRLEGEK